MTQRLPEAVRVPGQSPGHSALSRLVSTGKAVFAEGYWGLQGLLTRAVELPQSFDDLLDADSVDELISERGLRTPFLRVAKAGSTLSEKAFTAAGGVGATIADQVSDDKLVRLFAEGSTLVLQALHRTWPPIIALCQQLGSELGHPVQANAYVTPPQNQGFSAHYDVHDVFVLQVAGEKRWTIHSPVHESPLRDQPWTDRRAAVASRSAQAPTIEAVLRPGDCLYLPRGFLHSAEALGEVSTHLTLGVHVWTRFALAEQLLKQALAEVADDPAVRGSLAVGTSFTDATSIGRDVEDVRVALVDAIRRVDPETILVALRQQARAAQRAAPVGPLKQLHDAHSITEDSRVVLRRHLEATVDALPDRRVVLRSRAGDVDLFAEDVEGVRMLLANDQLTAGDLGLGLTRRLLLAGVAVLV